MNNLNLIQIKCIGDGIAPELIKASKLAETLIAIERILTPFIRYQRKNEPEKNAPEKLDSDAVTIRLIHL